MLRDHVTRKCYATMLKESETKRLAFSWLLQSRVLCLCFFQDGDIGICVLQEHKELLVALLCLFRVASQQISPAELESSECCQRGIYRNAALVQEFADVDDPLNDGLTAPPGR